MIATNFSIGKAISFGWDLMKKHWLVMIGIMIGFNVVTSIISLFGGTDRYSFWFWMVNIFVLILNYAYLAGYLKLYLNATDGEEPEFDVFKKTVKKVPGLIVLFILYTIAILIGLCLLIIPGIWLMIRLYYAPLIYLDREKCSIEEAYRESFRITKGHVWQLIGLNLASIGVALLGFLVCIVGVFPATVVCYFAYTASYRMLQYQEGHPVAQNISENPERQI